MTEVAPNAQGLELVEGLIGKGKRMTAAQAYDEFRCAVGKRLAMAREGAGISQIDAAQALGYAKATQLCYFERGDRLPGADKILQMVELYGTTADFIFGLTDSQDRDPAAGVQRELVAYVTGQMKRLANNMAAMNVGALRAMNVDHADVLALSRQVLEASTALAELRRLNPRLDDHAKGLARLVSRLDLAATQAQHCVTRINQSRRAVAAKSVAQAEDLLAGIGVQDLLFQPDTEKR